MFKPIQTNNTSSLQSIYIYTQKMNTLYILIRTSKNNLQTYSTKYNIIQCFNIINLHLYKKNWTPCIWIQSNLPNLNNQAFIACLINLHLCTKLVGHPVHGQRGEQSSKRKKATVTVEGDEKRGKGGVTKRSVTEVIRVVQVARTKGPFYYRVPLSSHARFENSSSVSRVAIIFSLVFPPPPPPFLPEESPLIYVVLHLTGPARKRVATGTTAWFHAWRHRVDYLPPWRSLCPRPIARER